MSINMGELRMLTDIANDPSLAEVRKSLNQVLLRIETVTSKND